MRNMSFSMTPAQIIDGSKTVTRRLGWRDLKPGDQVRPVKKCMGLKPGEKLEVLRAPLTVVSVRREELRAMLDNWFYGESECKLEGFGDHPEYRNPGRFVALFCKAHLGCTPNSFVTRIEFSYE